MNTEFEKIDSSAMEVLAEFPSSIDNTVTYRLGVAGENIILAMKSTAIRRSSPEQMTEREMQVDAYQRARDYWFGVIFFEKNNFAAVLKKLQQLYGEVPADEVKDGDLGIRQGKDLIAIERNSVMPHNVGKPIVSLFISNQRAADFDLRQTEGFSVYLEPEDGLKMMNEMKRIQPLIESKI